MSDLQKPHSARRTTAVIVVVLVVVIAAVAIIAVLTSRSAAPASQTSPSAQVTAPASTSATPTAAASSSAAPVPTVTNSASAASAAPSPQPTKTAALSSPAPIKKSLTAAVTKLEAVKGTATGPGEIAGPSVRFTVRITNGTPKAVSLADTVVNAYAGKDQSPALELSGPGAKDLPSSVAAGSSVTGVFVFNIPKAQRSQITVTVDTSTANPVLAFKGSAP